MSSKATILLDRKKGHSSFRWQVFLPLALLIGALGAFVQLAFQPPEKTAKVSQAAGSLSPPTVGSAHYRDGASAAKTAVTNLRPIHDRASVTVPQTPHSRASNLPRKYRSWVESAFAVDLVSHLSAIAGIEETLYAEQIEDLSHILSQLISEGPGAVAEIRRFLGGDQNIYLGETSGEFDYPTLRLALIDVLAEIGGPEAEQALFEHLQLTAEPLEIALIAEILDGWAPGQYRELIVDAVRETLAMVSLGELGPEVTDMGPLFHTLQNHGGADGVPSLEMALAKWGDYAIVTLAKLPSGEGNTALIRMAQSPSVAHSRQGGLALEMLAQVAVSDPEAEDALLAMAREDRIPDRLWSRVAQILAGDLQAQIEKPDPDNMTEQVGSFMKSNPYSTQTVTDLRTGQTQIIYRVNRSAVLPTEEFEQRLELIDALRGETFNPAAVEAINQIYANL